MKTAAKSARPTSTTKRKFKAGVYPQHRDEHRDRYHTDTLPDELLYDWYVRAQPQGPAPLSRMVCSLIEELAEIRKIKLPKPYNTLTVPTWRNI